MSMRMMMMMMLTIEIDLMWLYSDGCSQAHDLLLEYSIIVYGVVFLAIIST